SELSSQATGTDTQKQDFWLDKISFVNSIANSQGLDDTDYNTALTGTYIDTINPLANAILRDAIFGTISADTILGGLQNDYLFGGSGNDSMQGNAGNDTFIINQGDGADTITGYHNDDTVAFGTGITYAGLSI